MLSIILIIKMRIKLTEKEISSGIEKLSLVDYDILYDVKADK